MKLSGSDVAVSAAVLLGAAGLMYLFVTDLDAVSMRTGEKELGSVVFKKLTATRKAPGGLGWERMRNNSPVYDADTLRTAGFSEASVFFDDGTSLDMLENSMLRLDFGGKAKNLEFLSGEISVGSSAKATSYTISGTAGKISVEKGSKASFSREADTLSVDVSRGSASILKADGSSQAIARNQELQVDVKSGQASLVARPIVPLAPERNARLLSFAAAQESPTGKANAPAGIGKIAVDFAWQLEGDAPAPAGASYELQVARTKDFAAPEVATRVSGLAATARLGAGSWYWRVRDGSGKESSACKFSLDLSAPPRPAFPPDGQQYAYRSAKPSIRFAWTAMDEASSYLFELAADKDFSDPIIRSRTTTPSLAVDSLGEGSWYWRVSPVHAFTVVGEAPPVPARLIAIAKSPAMQAPSVTAPFDGSLYQIQDVEGKGLSFSWLPEAEAVSYQLVISKDKDLSSPIATIPASQSYLRLSGTAAELFKRPGDYYWGLRALDKEGNPSPASPSRLLRGFDGSVALRLSFPPEGYRIADSLITGTRFTWKSNVNARTIFQLARDSSFQDIAYQETVSAETLIGRAWKSGSYYWRLRTFNADGSVLLETQPRGFQVVDPLPAPPLLAPAPSSSFYLREHDQETFSWSPIEHADYYSLSLRSAADNNAELIFERTFLEGRSLAYPLGDLPSGSYRLSIQAFASSGDETTRIIGYIGDNNFNYRRLTYIKLGSPAEDSHVAGLDARRGLAIFAYGSEDKPDAAEVFVSTDAAGSKIVARAADRSGRAGVGRLDPGSYYWTVKGRLVGFDVSAKERFHFVVDPIPPLPAAELILPAPNAVIGPAELRAKHSIFFAWKPVPGANRYAFAIYPQGKEVPLFSRDALRSPGCELDDLSILDKGRFTWSVEARSYDGKDELEQPGIAARSSFTIDLPVLQKAKAGNPSRLYGK